MERDMGRSPGWVGLPVIATVVAAVVSYRTHARRNPGQ
jgi:hypothetical protein